MRNPIYDTHDIVTFKSEVARNIKKRWKIFILEKKNQFRVYSLHYESKSVESRYSQIVHTQCDRLKKQF